MVREFKTLLPKSADAKPVVAEPILSKVQGASLDQPEFEDAQSEEVGGRGGLDPVRYGDWEVKGRCIDF